MSAYHHGDLRAALLAGAERALRDKDGADLTLRELARDIGVSHTAPRRHFADKNALLDALAVTGYDRLTRAADEADDTTGSFARRLGARARAYLRFAADNGALLNLMLSRRSDADPRLRAALERTIGSMEHLVVEAQERGEILMDDPRRITLSIGAGLHGLVTFVANGSLGPDQAATALDALLRHLLQGLTPR